MFPRMFCRICYSDLLAFPICFQLAAVAALCVQYESDFRPNMTIVVKAITPLLNAPKPAAPAAAPQSWPTRWKTELACASLTPEHGFPLFLIVDVCLRNHASLLHRSSAYAFVKKPLICWYCRTHIGEFCKMLIRYSEFVCFFVCLSYDITHVQF